MTENVPLPRNPNAYLARWFECFNKPPTDEELNVLAQYLDTNEMNNEIQALLDSFKSYPKVLSAIEEQKRYNSQKRLNTRISDRYKSVPSVDQVSHRL